MLGSLGSNDMFSPVHNRLIGSEGLITHQERQSLSSSLVAFEKCEIVFVFKIRINYPRSHSSSAKYNFQPNYFYILKIYKT